MYSSYHGAICIHMIVVYNIITSDDKIILILWKDALIW